MIREFSVEELVIQWRPNKRRKRNVGFLFQPGGTLLLDAPPRTGQRELEEMVREHIRWIRHRLRQAKDQAPEHPPLSIEDGAVVPYLGDTLNVRWQAARQNSVTLDGNHLRVRSATPEKVRDLVRDWYKDQAATLFEERLGGWRHLPWLKGKEVVWRQRYMKSQWGSCSAQGKLSLNTHLAKVPEELVDYVLLHELCHIKYMDHSRRFYGLMEEHMPDWDRRRRALHRYVGVLLGD